MNKLKPHFRLSKEQRSGVFVLFIIVLILQWSYFYVKNATTQEVLLSKVEYAAIEQQIDSLENWEKKPQKSSLYKFNPNYMTSYKSYVLGVPNDAFEKLQKFRAKGSYVNSIAEFQKVTQISDSLLNTIAPYFKFPDWLKKKKVVKSQSFSIPVKDVNTATASDFKKIKGVGDKLSKRIVNFRTALKGFLHIDQLKDVYGLSDEVVLKLKKQFKVISKPKIKKLNLNTVTLEELTSLVYINYQLGLNIIEYRTLNGELSSFEELKKVDHFPIGKIDRIQLYLSLE